MFNVYRFADLAIGIDSIYPRVHEYCEEYICDKKPDFIVKITQDDIDFERERSRRTAELENREPYNSREDYLEELAVYRKISEKMPYYDTFLFHGSCVAVDGEAYLFTAKSGTGKSTHTRLWREMLGDKAVMVNDDKPLIKVSDEGVRIFGTPYNGKHRLGSNISVRLKAVCILERAQQNSIRSITKDEAYPMLIQQTYRPLDGLALAKTMPLIDKLAQSVGLYKLGCNMDISAAEIAYNMMKG